MSKKGIELAKKGEQIAVSYLLKKGYKIEKLNFNCQLGEIDIVARDKEILAFIEVKTRLNRDFGSGIEAVDYYKQRKLNRLALYYLVTLPKEKQDVMCRFDVVSVMLDSKGEWRVELIKNAFPFLNN